MIERLIIKNYKGILKANIEFNPDRNVIVGNNGAGKSTIVEALSLVLGYGLSQLEIVQPIFNIESVNQFLKDKILPEILIEVYFSEEKPEFSGTNNSLHEYKYGIQLKIHFDDEGYQDLFNKEKSTCTQLPCEYYILERNWFSDQRVIQRSMPYSIQVVDSSSSFFNSSSNQYVARIIQKYLGDQDNIKLKSCLRQLKQDFEEKEQLSDINKAISDKNKNLKISIDVSSSIISRNIICPIINDIPVEQIGAGDLCILKTMLSLDRTSNIVNPKIVIIEEPESHLSHTKMYELLQQIENNLDSKMTQLIITTHNSFIANKLNLSKLILINNEHYNISTKSIKDDEETASFFTKVSNYPTLRLILCKCAILVEGPTDEMLLTYCYNNIYGSLPFNDGIELISVNGVSFKSYSHLMKDFNNKIAIITDNDNCSIANLINKRGLSNLPNNIKIFTDSDNTKNFTIEPSFVSANKDHLQELSNTVRAKKESNDTFDKLVEYMSGNKTEWAFRLLKKNSNAATKFNAPAHIIDAFKWIRDE